MHPSRLLRQPGQSEEDEFEALLREQAAFDRGTAPAAKVFRAPPRVSLKPDVGLGASEDGPPQPSNGSRKGSLFKQLRQGLLGGDMTASSVDRPFGMPAAIPHPEISALPDENEELSSCLAEHVLERGDVKVPTASLNGEVTFPSPMSGFPVASHRAVGKSLARSFQPKSKPVEDTERTEPENEEDAIDQENQKAISAASPEEVMEWQQQLLQHFGREACEFLKRRGQEKLQKRSVAASPPTPSTSSKAPVKNEAPSSKVTSVGLDLSFRDQELSAEDIQSMNILRTFEGGCLDRAELQKLQWTSPAGEPDIAMVVSDPSLPPEPAGKVVQLLRFDFDGRVCLRQETSETLTDKQVGPYEGLHHHGAESSQAGYTISELLILTRSASAPQRALALSIFASILARARSPADQAALAEDPALCEAGDLKKDQSAFRAGFGVGLGVFFWHGLARGDVPKHLAEASKDTSLPVQIAALRAVVALLEISEKESSGSVVRSQSQDDESQSERSTIPLSNWDAARLLIWPKNPPDCTYDLAKRARVTVLSGEGHGGSGGGSAAWPQLLRETLLRARPEPEVTAADILEPLLPVEEALEGPPALAVAAQRCVAFAFLGRGDASLLGLVSRVLSVASTWTPELCFRLLESVSTHREDLLRAAALGTLSTSGSQDLPECERLSLQLNVLTFLRRSCEVGGRTATSWWMQSTTETFHDEASTSTPSTWTAISAVRKAVLGVVGTDVDFEGLPPTAFLTAVEGLRIWIAWLRSGSGVDRLQSFFSLFGRLLHRLALEPAKATDPHWLLASTLLQLAKELCDTSDDAPSQDPILPLSVAGNGGIRDAVLGILTDVSVPLANALTASQASVNQQLCLATFAEWLEAASVASSKVQTAIRTLILSENEQTSFPEASLASASSDAESPWPYAGTILATDAMSLARLRALTAIVRLAALQEDEVSKRWLCHIHKKVAEVINVIAPEVPVAVCSEALVNVVNWDPWTLLLAETCLALKEDAKADNFGLVLSKALRLTGSWTSAQRLFRACNLFFSPEAEDSIVHAAFKLSKASTSFPSRQTQRNGPPSLAIASAPFWSLLKGVSSDIALDLIKVLGARDAEILAHAAPPWLPFLAFIAVLSRTLDSGSRPWSEEGYREALQQYAERHLKSKDPRVWLTARDDWLTEALRGICDRLAAVFLEDSYGDSLIAAALWAFALPSMPSECRAIAWGAEEPALLPLLSRALRIDGAVTATSKTLLLWPQEAYLEADEDHVVLRQAKDTFGREVSELLSLNSDFTKIQSTSWPSILAAHYIARDQAIRSPFDLSDAGLDVLE